MQTSIVRRSDVLSTLDARERHQPEALIRALFRAREEVCDPASDYVLGRLYPPDKLKGIDGAVRLLASCLRSQNKITIVGDFDADGATSTALLWSCLRAFGAGDVDYIVPNRFEYGYGLTPEIVELAAAGSPHLIVTVDNGISSIEGVEAAKARGIQVLVTDHHLPGKQLPRADAIVNPNQPGCSFPSKHLAGVGVIFYVLLALRAHLRKNRWFEERGVTEPNMGQFLDLVALGTVADVVPLDFNNRILVAQGIQRIRSGASCPGILALLKIAGRDFTKLSANDFGFAVGPRLNAAGRLDDMSIGIRCLISRDELEALEVAQQLDDLNRERRAIEASMKADAEKELVNLALDAELKDRNGICLYRGDWHQGVVGILASRIKDQTHRPTIVFADASEEEIKGSGRSIHGVHLRDVLDELAAQAPSLLQKFGGHAMAAGLSIAKKDLSAFSELFDRVLARHLKPEMRNPVILSDGELFPEQLTLPHAQVVKEAGPWGQAFPEPIFDGVFRVIEQRLVGGKHLKLLLSPQSLSDCVIDAIAFGVDLDVWPNDSVNRIEIAYKLDVNEFRGRSSAQLIVSHMAALPS